MRLTTKLSAFMTLLTGLAIFVTLVGCSISFFNEMHYKVHQRVVAVATIIDNDLVSSSPEALIKRLNEVMVPIDIIAVDFKIGDNTVYQHQLTQTYRLLGNSYSLRTVTVELMKHPGMFLSLTYRDPVADYYKSLFATVPLSITIGFMLIVLFFAIRWMKKQLAGQELLISRARCILNGERSLEVRGSVLEWPPQASSALDVLLSDLQTPANNVAEWIL